MILHQEIIDKYRRLVAKDRGSKIDRNSGVSIPEADCGSTSDRN
jgi:hypothetical protein